METHRRANQTLSAQALTIGSLEPERVQSISPARAVGALEASLFV